MLYDFTLTGVTPLLLHADDVELADELGEWRKDPKNKNISKAGDDRSPPWTWKTYAYTDGENITVPSDNLMVSLREAGATMKIKGNTTYKSVTQSGLLISDLHIPVLVNGKTVSAAKVEAIEGDFKHHAEAVKPLGFVLFVKRAKVGSSKHIRVRPRFEVWQLRGRIEVMVQEITGDVLKQLFDIAGKYKGLCDWRPSSKQSPGPFGRFEAEVVKVNGKAK